jgi:hypothetical protein
MLLKLDNTTVLLVGGANLQAQWGLYNVAGGL